MESKLRHLEGVALDQAAQTGEPDWAHRANNEVQQNDLRRLIEEYAADLRAIIRELRQKMN
ncbi:hypothetical protein GA0061098_10336 [Bradyrhizobium shewense]|uniref:Uncharacterized protein n=1 Tax=Bradyrhizobium shewense TaxID=1761772 RepID=A0A1C3XRQ9_9BRAD|nr:hypothetical protein [Bradyrhizobium shewense]SCB54963.1 hypothetical protein GA0061098_10336 [Bradyrhizobium shewense]